MRRFAGSPISASCGLVYLCAQEPTPLTLSSATHLLALRKLDIFHRWESIDEGCYCRCCGKIITGEQIKVFGGPRNDHPSRLECPTEGCLSVPLEWIMLDAAAGVFLNGAEKRYTAEPTNGRHRSKVTGEACR